MATSNASSIVNFVKKYPITLCGFSLLFMPSVHRLLLYFTPLLLSTAIFIVAMLTWGPSTESSDESKGKRKGKRNEWAFNGSLKIYDEDDEEEEGEEKEEEEEEVAQVSQARKEELSVEEKERKKLEAQIQEPDPDFDEESKRVGTASIGAIFPDQAEPDPDLGGDGVGTASNGADLHRDRSATPDLQGDCVGTASSAAEPDPDLHGEQHVEAAHNHDFSAAKHQLHAAPDHHRQHHLHDHAKLAAPINHDEQAAAGDHHLDSEPDHLDFHDAASDQANHGDDDVANQGDDYHDAEADPDLHGSDCEAAHAKSEGAVRGARVENDDVRAAIAELRQKLGLVQRDGRDHMHPQQIAKGLQTLQAAA